MRQGLHPLENVKRTARAYMGFINNESVLGEIIGSILKTGYDADFVALLTEIAETRKSELASGHQSALKVSA